MSVTSAQTSPHPKDTHFHVLFVFQQNGWAEPFSTSPHLWRRCQHGRCWCQNRARRALQRRRIHHQHGHHEDVSLTWLARKSSTGGPPVDAASLLLPFGKMPRGEKGCPNREKLSLLFESLSLSQQDGSPGKELPHRQSPSGQKELTIDRAEGQANFKEGLWQHSWWPYFPGIGKLIYNVQRLRVIFKKKHGSRLLFSCSS